MSQKDVDALKEAINRLRKKQYEQIRQMAEILGEAKSTICYILKKKDCHGGLSNTKRSGRPKKTTKMDDNSGEKPIITSSQVRKTLKEVDVSLSQSTIKRRLHECKYRGFNHNVKTTGNTHREARLDLDRKHLKQPAHF